jgi:hypothetical protein
LAETFKRDVIKHHQAQLRHNEQFQREFARLVKEHFSDKRLIIFVDDLDRCLPEKAIEVLEAIKLFLDVDGCVFVLGLDQQMIARGIETKYEKSGRLTTDLFPVGEHYVEKIIQLPFLLPQIESIDMEVYLNSFNADWPNEDCVKVFAEGLPPNPRQVKRTVNVFMLLWKLAEKRRSRIGHTVTALRLAKVVALQTAHPKAFDQLKLNPLALKQLESYCQEHPDDQSGDRSVGELTNTILREAGKQDGVRRLFQLFYDREDARFAELGTDELLVFFTLARRVPSMVVEAPELVDSAQADGSVDESIAEDIVLASPQSLHQLRAEFDKFIGREEEIALLLEALQDGNNHAAVLISGMPGVGKTALALLVANRLKDNYPDAQLFVPLTDVKGKPRSDTQVSKTCVLPFTAQNSVLPRDAEGLRELYLKCLGGKRAIIVLDDAVHDSQVQSLLPPEGCITIITSRSELTLNGVTHVTLNLFQPDEGRNLIETWS